MQVFLRKDIIPSFSNNYCLLVQKNTLFITLMNRVFKTEKLRLSKTEKNMASKSNLAKVEYDQLC